MQVFYDFCHSKDIIKELIKERVETLLSNNTLDHQYIDISFRILEKTYILSNRRIQ